ncbi:hypothetical protein VHEMI01538 [[Torrubiella] hemipterigena]|uniref:Methyltransferase domain-containing protein n=1 Tax=[Torrubiella] hemipterigena TaxID=1531966 RepID=A0A0A1SM66_9HYPO|nr:hypothetical protein VHEMI01538 [[Torrubiella] hemipterigena]
MANPNHLEPSELGTKEYWDNLYTRELSNNEADPTDIGTVWFDDSDAEQKMLQFLRLLASDADEQDSDDEDDDPANFDLPDITLSRETTSFLDLGTGNGSLLSSLATHNFSGPLHGIDYSPQSVALARKIAEAKGQPITFTTWDLLAGPMEDAFGDQKDGYDVLLDKGTFDAISLSAATNESGQRIMAGYRPRATGTTRLVC